MKILSWNVNGLKSIIKKGFKEIVKELDEDIICIQEIKTSTAIRGFELEGYYSYYNFSTVLGYSGVATFTKKKPNNIFWGIKINQEDEENIDNEARVLTLEYNDFYVVNVYVPHPQTKNERREYRDNFNKKFIQYIKKLRKNVIICGDFNVCHQNIDIYTSYINRKQEQFIKEQRLNFTELLQLGLIDSFRYMHPQMRKYTLKANHIQKLETDKFGWRIDYILISKDMRKEIKQANIFNEITGSDHCPIELVLKLSNGNENINYGDKVLFIPKDYIKGNNFGDCCYIKSSFDNEILGNIWENYDFDRAEEDLFKLQCKLTKAVINRNKRKIINIQNEIVYSTMARMLAVRQVSEKNRSSPGIDGIVWQKASDKMKAAISLNNGKYKSTPLRQYVFYDNKCAKERKVGIPTIYDRAMQVLYFYALDPVAEATADRRSFAFRKTKSPEQMHSYIMKALTDENAPEWILVSDIKSYYDTIAHKWILKNIPMNKSILKQFLKSKYVFNGELFETNEGISLGCNISTVIGNMTLDGLQKELYTLQGNNVKDFYNGQCLRFADDVLITARTKEDAVKLKNKLKDFVSKRGLRISKEKTKIINIKDGFDFLSRYYCKIDGEIRCIPSEKAVNKFEEEVKFLIFNNKDRWSISKLIDSINRKISGFATYHKVEEARKTFIHLDVVINAFLLKMVKEFHPTYSNNQLIRKYWVKDAEGRAVFTTPDKRRRYVKNMADIILINEKPIDLKKNVYLDRDYFKHLEYDKNIQNVIGKYRKVYDRQER